jgi:hypothetical protein
VAQEKLAELMAMPTDERMPAILTMAPEERADFARGLNEQERMQLYD